MMPGQQETASKTFDRYPVTCKSCSNSGSLSIWSESGRWGVEWDGFYGGETLRVMPRRAHARCRRCRGRSIEIGPRAAAQALPD